MNAMVVAEPVAGTEAGLRVALTFLSVWATQKWWRLTLGTTREGAEALVQEAAPDATPYELLPNAAQRASAVEAWESEGARRIRWLWDTQIARLMAFTASTAILAVIGSMWWPVAIFVLWLVPCVPLFRVSQLNDQRAQALAALASRSAELARKIRTPGPD